MMSLFFADAGIPQVFSGNLNIFPGNPPVTFDSAHPEIGKFGRDRGARKILPQAYG
ncbi:hypothetical protein DESC_120179 [Desulfosarcina cetonica]|nr:hypothetical protein DESC_120179 [Desulfosarcina cetonica]